MNFVGESRDELCELLREGEKERNKKNMNNSRLISRTGNIIIITIRVDALIRSLTHSLEFFYAT